jgi:glycosyltransferase involved in cell wall biosynthesis
MQPSLKKRHRILFFEKPAFVGGSVTGLYELVRGLDPARFEPIVLFGGPNPYRAHFQALGVRVETLSEEIPQITPTTRDIAAGLSRYNRQAGHGYRRLKDLYLLGKRDYPLAKQVARRIEAWEIDLVHHNNCLRTNRATVLGARLARVRQIVHVRSLEPFGPVERYLADSVSAFIYMSRAVEKLYRGLDIPQHKGHVLYDGFVPPNAEADPAQLRAEFGLTPDDLVISNVGRFDWWKGHETFIQAMAAVVQTLPHAKALLVGGVDSTPRNQAFYREIQQMVQSLGLERHIIFTGYRADIPQIMAMSDLIVHSSSEPEPFGRVIVEAMLVGRPVVATAAGGVLDIVTDHETGILVPPKDAAAMAQAIQELLQHPDRAKAMGRQGRDAALHRFSVDQHVQGMQTLYQSILCSES